MVEVIALGVTHSTQTLIYSIQHQQGNAYWWHYYVVWYDCNDTDRWALCDGTNGTPNLTGKFIVHADSDSSGTYAVGATGGANDVTLATSELPAHSHTGTAVSGGDTRILERQTVQERTRILILIVMSCKALSFRG